jgi:hypothetical protein
MAGTNSSNAGTTSTTTYRVTIDVQKIQSNVYRTEGGRLSELAVHNWLRSVGFRPEPGGKTWLADRESLGRLDQSEILRAYRVRSEHPQPASL